MSLLNRRKTREVMIGHIGVGGKNPIRVQSMTTSATGDVENTVSQAIRLYEAGCEIVRVTVQGKKEAYACEAIKNTLIKKGYQIPLVADIHFYPPAALIVADFVDKVRINPGNFADKRASFKVIEYTDSLYQKELEKIEEKFAPLVLKCKSSSKAIRIGVNHGSLSDRILNRFGDTPRGMVESAFEYAQICRKYDFHQIVFSMKSSNPKVMIEAYRLLVSMMDKKGWDYPIHLGVTEAGQGVEGRVKSSVGIGSLLLEGIGDTIRVSLTEDPWEEIKPAKKLIQLLKPLKGSFQVKKQDSVMSKKGKSSFLHPDASVGIFSEKFEGDHCDFIVTKDSLLKTFDGKTLPIKDLDDLKKAAFCLSSNEKVAVKVNGDHLEELTKVCPEIIFYSSGSLDKVAKARSFFSFIQKHSIEAPVILQFDYTSLQEMPWDDFVLLVSAEIGSLLCDHLGDGILLKANYSPHLLASLSFNILQSCRKRSIKTEFISCPSCGRTLFDLQEVSQRIRKKTGHLPGVKIAIMGCIVNGPGEMADADFGYVGSKPGKIDLYIGKKCVEKNIDESQADDRLIELIKACGKWVDPFKRI